jgi:hypothetical protein
MSDGRIISLRIPAVSGSASSNHPCTVACRGNRQHELDQHHPRHRVAPGALLCRGAAVLDEWSCSSHHHPHHAAPINSAIPPTLLPRESILRTRLFGSACGAPCGRAGRLAPGACKTAAPRGPTRRRRCPFMVNRPSFKTRCGARLAACLSESASGCTRIGTAGELAGALHQCYNAEMYCGQAM